MIDTGKVIEEIEARTGKKLDDEQSKAVLDGFMTMMNMLWSNQEKQKNSNQE